MTVLFFVFVGLVIFHFAWEGIIAPSLRIEIRYELFKVRDELRRLKISHGNEIDDELFIFLQNGINKGIRLLHDVTIETAYRAYKEATPEELERVSRIAEDCPVDGVKEVYNRSGLYVGLAFLVNSGGWFAYLVPILIAFIGFTKVKKFTREIFNLSDNDINRIFPHHMTT